MVLKHLREEEELGEAGEESQGSVVIWQKIVQTMRYYKYEKIPQAINYKHHKLYNNSHLRM